MLFSSSPLVVLSRLWWLTPAVKTAELPPSSISSSSSSVVAFPAVVSNTRVVMQWPSRFLYLLLIGARHAGIFCRGKFELPRPLQKQFHRISFVSSVLRRSYGLCVCLIILNDAVMHSCLPSQSLNWWAKPSADDALVCWEEPNKIWKILFNVLFEF